MSDQGNKTSDLDPLPARSKTAATSNEELTEDSVCRLDSDLLLKVFLGFSKAKEGSDYEVATRRYREICYRELRHRLHRFELLKGALPV